MSTDSRFLRHDEKLMSDHHMIETCSKDGIDSTTLSGDSIIALPGGYLPDSSCQEPPKTGGSSLASKNPFMSPWTILATGPHLRIVPSSLTRTIQITMSSTQRRQEQFHCPLVLILAGTRKIVLNYITPAGNCPMPMDIIVALGQQLITWTA